MWVPPRMARTRPRGRPWSPLPLPGRSVPVRSGCPTRKESTWPAPLTTSPAQGPASGGGPYARARGPQAHRDRVPAAPRGPRFARAFADGRPRRPREYRFHRAWLLLAVALGALATGMFLAHGLLIAAGLVFAGVAGETLRPAPPRARHPVRRRPGPDLAARRRDAGRTATPAVAAYGPEPAR